MLKTITKLIAVAVLFTGGLFGTAQALPANMVVTGSTNPPIGHYEFCKIYASECTSNGKDGGPMVLTREGWQKILEINYDVNQAITPMTDMEIHGVEEKWSYPETVGDCEDYVLLKRRKLIENGFSASDLLITVVLQPNGDGHAVLTVRTDRGDFILDNKRNAILPWSQTGYTYVKRESQARTGWASLGGLSTSTVASLR